MSKLEELIGELCPDVVEYKELGEILTIKNGRDYKSLGNGNIPVYGSGGIMTYVDSFVFNKPTVLIPRKGSIEKLYYVETPFWNVDTIFYTDIDTDFAIPKYIYYCLQSEHLEELNTAGGVPSLTQAVLKKVTIPVPPLPVQSEIVRILDNFTELTAVLTAELIARKRQYEYYKNILFSFSSNVKWTKLSDVCEIYDSLHKTPKYSNTGFPMVRVVDVKGDAINRTTCLKVDEQVYKQFIKKYKPKLNDIVISRVGSYGNVGLVLNDDVCLGQNVALISAKYCSYNFLFYYLQSNLVRVFIESNVKGASQKTLSLAKIKDIPFPKLSEEEQNRISVVMGNFHKICNDISTGLPAEIKARTKQYEYYRDKLLTFKELT